MLHPAPNFILRSLGVLYTVRSVNYSPKKFCILVCLLGAMLNGCGNDEVSESPEPGATDQTPDDVSGLEPGDDADAPDDASEPEPDEGSEVSGTLADLSSEEQVELCEVSRQALFTFLATHAEGVCGGLTWFSAQDGACNDNSTECIAAIALLSILPPDQLAELAEEAGLPISIDCEEIEISEECGLVSVEQFNQCRGAAIESLGNYSQQFEGVSCETIEGFEVSEVSPEDIPADCGPVLSNCSSLIPDLPSGEEN